MATYSTSSPQTNSDGFGSTTHATRSGPSNAEGDGGPTRAAIARTGLAGEGVVATSDYSFAYLLGRYNDPVQSVDGVNPDGVALGSTARASRQAVPAGIESPTAAYIPSAYFRLVDGVAINPKGERITDAKWIIAQDGLPTAGKVDDNGEFEINLLRNEYENFALLVEAEDYSGLDYVWYQYRRTVVDSTRAEVVLVFEESEVTNGLNASVGVKMG
ncbi:hypothetical protein [Natrinema thermotolerans]